ncbi:hypothetical protein [Rhodanobacter sp. B04]|uniref:hypothetical protein n=1 Tax=Rhodanobacter sp. B04 TaxID=1945860 RepID=UPI00111578C7|nr:hypothetical protein [Rhodanobacter sp. B04]
MNMLKLQGSATRAVGVSERFCWRLRAGMDDLFCPQRIGYALKPVPVRSKDASGERSHVAARASRRGAP